MNITAGVDEVGRGSLIGPVYASDMIELHKRYISWWGKKLKISNYGLLWVSFIKGILIGLLIYHFLII